MNIGDKIKNFSVTATAIETFNLNDYKDKTIILYFYPRDNTPGCTQESIEFNENLNKFKKLGVEVFGISRDSLKSHDKFKTKYDFKFELLADESEEICNQFGVMKEKNMYGKKVMGIERSTFIIQNGKLIHEWRKVKVNGHVEEVLEKVKEI